MSGAEPMFQIRIRACPDRLRLLRRWVKRAAELAGCRPEVAAQVVIAVNEACMNVIQHAYRGDPTRDLVLEIEKDGNELRCRVIDFAPPADPASIGPRDLDELRPGGLGTHFMAELMDGCCYGHLEAGSGNFLELSKKIA